MGETLPGFDKPVPGRLGDILRPLGVIMRLVSPDIEYIFTELVKLQWSERLAGKAESTDVRLLQAVEKCVDTQQRQSLIPEKR
ncbi:MAG: hypothetical protein PHE50_09785 [Dehalococcoidales bacterium]|nr:hypothetical protein [Dehalococcoidales bacterium]